jgi:hypothetical protein
MMLQRPFANLPALVMRLSKRFVRRANPIIAMTPMKVRNGQNGADPTRYTTATQIAAETPSATSPER